MDDRIRQLNAILRITAESLDLSPTQHKEATDKYQAVGKWLSAEDSSLKRFKPNVYPHGSFELGTSVKPIGRDDFDIDLVVELSIGDDTAPNTLKMLVGVRLAQNETYKKILEEKNRCWRLNYTKLHLDSLPAKLKIGSATGTAILIPDKELKSYKDSDPKGYIAWFRLQCLVGRDANEASVQATVAPAPEQQTARDKAPLQIAVQILKRHRDVYFQVREGAPISIILTTLAAKAYRQEGDPLSTLRGVIQRLHLGIERIGGKPYVFNPVNRGENFADKWHKEPHKEQAFYEWQARANKDILELERAARLFDVGRILERFVGKNRATIILQRYAEQTTATRGSGLKADLATGLLSSVATVTGAAATVRDNTFYGDAVDS